MKRKDTICILLAMVAVIGLLFSSLALAAEETVTGVIEKTDQGFVISSDDGNSYIAQGQDLSDMIGKSVKVTGTLTEEESGMTISITKVEEITEMNE